MYTVTARWRCMHCKGSKAFFEWTHFVWGALYEHDWLLSCHRCLSANVDRFPRAFRMPRVPRHLISIPFICTRWRLRCGRKHRWARLLCINGNLRLQCNEAHWIMANNTFHFGQSDLGSITCAACVYSATQFMQKCASISTADSAETLKKSDKEENNSISCREKKCQFVGCYCNDRRFSCVLLAGFATAHWPTVPRARSLQLDGIVCYDVWFVWCLFWFVVFISLAIYAVRRP